MRFSTICFVLLLIPTAFIPTALSARGDHYDPLELVNDSQARTLEINVQDKPRQSEIPIKVYLPMREASNGKNTLPRYRDVRSVLDRLDEWNERESHPLHDRLDFEHVGMSGHSFGAQTTSGVSGLASPRLGPLFTDDRIDAALSSKLKTGGN